VIDAILAVEDNEFYVHKGVNVRGLIRATLSNFASDAPRQGASTITQQVVKNDSSPASSATAGTSCCRSLRD
jgi:membrane peptidoglycan carboxypeptidase